MELFVDARLCLQARIGYAETWAEYKQAKDALLAWVHHAVCRERAYRAARADIEGLFATAERNIAAQNKIIAIALRMRA